MTNSVKRRLNNAVTRSYAEGRKWLEGPGRNIARRVSPGKSRKNQLERIAAGRSPNNNHRSPRKRVVSSILPNSHFLNPIVPNATRVRRVYSNKAPWWLKAFRVR